MGTLFVAWEGGLDHPLPPLFLGGGCAWGPSVPHGVFQRGFSAVVMKLGQVVTQST